MKKKEKLVAVDIPIVHIEIKYGNDVTILKSHPYDIMSNKIMFGKYRPNPMFYEIELLEYIRRKHTGGVVLDIGANIGNHSMYFAKFVFDKTIAFEPNYKNFAILGQNKLLNNLDDEKLVIHNVALSDGYYDYQVVEYSDSFNMGSSTIEEGVTGTGIITKKLDDFDLPEISLIKLDVEGHELKVLKGGEALINRDFPDIILESMINGQGAPERIDPYMKEIGYRMVESFPEYCMYYYKHS